MNSKLIMVTQHSNLAENASDRSFSRWVYKISDLKSQGCSCIVARLGQNTCRLKRIIKGWNVTASRFSDTACKLIQSTRAADWRGVEHGDERDRKKCRWHALHQQWHLCINSWVTVGHRDQTRKPLIKLKGVTRLMRKDPWAPFSQECLLNKTLRVNRKQMCVVSVCLHFPASTTCERSLMRLCLANANRKRKRKRNCLLSANSTLWEGCSDLTADSCRTLWSQRI